MYNRLTADDATSTEFSLTDGLRRLLRTRDHMLAALASCDDADEASYWRSEIADIEAETRLVYARLVAYNNG